MDSSEFFAQLEIEFEIDIPAGDQARMQCMRDIRDYVHAIYRERGIVMPAVAIFERLRRSTASVLERDSATIKPETSLSEFHLTTPKRAWF